MDDLNIDVDIETIFDIYRANKNNPYTDVASIEMGCGPPVVHYDGFFPQEDEVIIFAVPANLFVEKQRITGYTGGSVGASVKVAKGVTMHTSDRDSSPIREAVRDFFPGDFLVTNKRIIFIASSNSFEYSLNKITAVKFTGLDTMYIQTNNATKNLMINEYNLKYALYFTNYAIENQDDDDPLYELLRKGESEEQKKISEELKTVINNIGEIKERELEENIKKQQESIEKEKREEKKENIIWLIMVIGIILFFYLTITVEIF